VQSQRAIVMAGASKSNNSAQGTAATSKPDFLNSSSTDSFNRASIKNGMNVKLYFNLTI